MSVDNFFYYQQIYARPPKVAAWFKDEREVQQPMDLVSLTYEEGSEYYKKTLYPSVKSMKMKTFRDIPLLSEVVVHIFYSGHGDRGLSWYDAHDKRVVFKGYVAGRSYAPASIKNPSKLFSYELKTTHLDTMDSKLSYGLGDTLGSVLARSPFINGVYLPLNPRFTREGEDVELRKILEHLEEYLYFKEGGGVIVFEGGELKYLKSNKFIELTGNSISNSLQIQQKEDHLIKAIYMTPRGEERSAEGRSANPYPSGAFSATASLSKNHDGTYKNLANGRNGVVINDKKLIDFNVGKIVKKENDFVADNERREFLTAIKERERTQALTLTLNPFLFDLPLSTDIHFLHEELRFKAMVFKKKFSLDLGAKKLSLALSCLKYSEEVEKLPLEGKAYDQGLVYAL